VFIGASLFLFDIYFWYLHIYRVSQKKCELRRLVQNCTFLCNSPVWRFFFKFWKFVNFFGTSNGQKKIREPFSFSKSKVQKSKNVYINSVYRNLKIVKDWIKESQKIRKIFNLNSLVPFFLVYFKVLNIRCSVET